ncbi:putative GMC oxidoreductase [Hypoxylon sp. CI-4A]|nr:putative GMC oxidoreductase [Hypoxylon sp. CI-4A]
MTGYSKFASLGAVTAGLFQLVLGSNRPLGSSFGIPAADATYDYVIVGGGTAGLTLATRLRQQNAGSVAIVEAGSFYETTNGNQSQIPADASIYTTKGQNDWQPLADWGYVTVPQEGVFNESIHLARGRMLGGSSARNFMIYQRGSNGSYQQWADAVGDDSYAWENFLPFFEKSVNFTAADSSLRFSNSTPDYDITTLGDANGPLSITYPNYAYPFSSWGVNALKEIGMNAIDGFVSGDLIGSSYLLSTINADTMYRESSETSFLRIGLDDPDYTVYTLTMAKKIVFDDSKTATGVLVDTIGSQYTLSARKEVIVSAGAIGSPQLLQASGVGPSDLLNSLNIPVVADRPGVGQNLQDHLYFGVAHKVNAVTASALGSADFAAQAAEAFDTDASGILTNGGFDVLGFEKLPASSRTALSNQTQTLLANDYSEDWPELEYIVASAYLGDMSGETAAPSDGNYATLAVVLNTPRSKGTVTITSSDTSVQPAIDPRYLTDQADVDVTVAGFKRAREFWATDALKDFADPTEAYPGTNVTTDADIEDIIRQSFNGIYHLACTCAMGKEDDENAVVDPQAKVYGVSNLRVVDASAFPFLPPGHPQSSVYALAEKIACDISGNC